MGVGIAQSDPPSQVFSCRIAEIDILQHDVYTFDKIQISLPIHSEETRSCSPIELAKYIKYIK